jgi:hypothetical protein
MQFDLTFKPLVAPLSHLKNEIKRGSVVVGPMIVGDASTKILLLVICSSLTSIDYPVVILMLSIQKRRDLRTILGTL